MRGRQRRRTRCGSREAVWLHVYDVGEDRVRECGRGSSKSGGAGGDQMSWPLQWPGGADARLLTI